MKRYKILLTIPSFQRKAMKVLVNMCVGRDDVFGTQSILGKGYS